MCTWMRVASCLPLACCYFMTEQDRDDQNVPLARIKALAAKGTAHGNPELEQYLKSLSVEDMLMAARQACQEVEENRDKQHDMPAWAAAESGSMLCLRHFFDKVDRDRGGEMLLKIVRDRSEPPLFRRALISLMGSGAGQFNAAFAPYVEAHEDAVLGDLNSMLMDREEESEVRTEVLEYLGTRLDAEVRAITASDLNVRAIRERTHKIVNVAGLIRSGELVLTESTQQALKPVIDRTLAFVRVLGAILGEPGEHLDELRQTAVRYLEGYRRSPLTEIDGQVEEALRQHGN